MKRRAFRVLFAIDAHPVISRLVMHARLGEPLPDLPHEPLVVDVGVRSRWLSRWWRQHRVCRLRLRPTLVNEATPIVAHAVVVGVRLAEAPVEVRALPPRHLLLTEQETPAVWGAHVLAVPPGTLGLRAGPTDWVDALLRHILPWRLRL